MVTEDRNGTRRKVEVLRRPSFVCEVQVYVGVGVLYFLGRRVVETGVDYRGLLRLFTNVRKGQRS